MARSQRVLSGSLTKGSTATPSGSIIFLYQGVNAKTNESYFGSLLPRIGSGDRLALYRYGKRLPEKTFDDSITMNSDPADIRGEGDDPVSTRIDFRFESRNFGQLDQRPEGYSFIETREYDAVGYLQDPGTTMWPVNLFNASMLPKYEYDGVIEPLDIRAEILGILDTRYEGHSVRGSLMGAVGEGPLGSRRIKETWFKYDPPAPWFLDAPDSFGHDRLATSSPWAPNEGVMPLQAFQNLDQGEDYPFVERDYQNEVYAEVTSHNPGSFIPVSTPMNWNYALTSSFQTANEAISIPYQYLSPGSLVIWHRYERAVPSTTTNPGAGGFLDSSINNYTGSIYTNQAPSLSSLSTSYPSAYIGTGSWWFNKDGLNNNGVWIGGKHISGGTLGDIFAQKEFFHKPWTWAFWIKQDAGSFTSYQYPINLGAYGAGNYHSIQVKLQNGGVTVFSRGKTAADRQYRLTSPTTGIWGPDTWTHIVIQQVRGAGLYLSDRDTWRIYVNGVDRSGGTISSTPLLDQFDGLAGTNFFMLGGYISHWGDSTLASDFRGQIAEFAAWDTVLGSDEINALYDVPTSGIKTVFPEAVTYTLKLASSVRIPWRSVHGNDEYNMSGELVGWWRFSDTDRSQDPALIDASGNENDGTASSSPTWNSGTSQSNYISEGSYVADFNGAGNQYYITKASGGWADIVGANLNAAYEQFTIAVWIKVDSYAVRECIWHFGDSTDGEYLEMQFDGDGDLLIRWATAGWIATESSAKIHAAGWHHVVLTQRPMPSDGSHEDDSTAALVNSTSRFRLYIDGELETWTSGDFTTAYADPANWFFVGGDATGSDFYDGKLMELSLWTSTFDQQTVRALYNASYVGVQQYSLGGTVYSSVVTEQNNDMTTALQLLNSASYRNSSDPLETRAHHGFYFGQKAGSITYGDI